MSRLANEPESERANSRPSTSARAFTDADRREFVRTLVIKSHPASARVTAPRRTYVMKAVPITSAASGPSPGLPRRQRLVRLVELDVEVVELRRQELARVLDRLVVDRRPQLLHEEVEDAVRGEVAELLIERL